MSSNSILSAFFYDKNGNKVAIDSEEVYFELDNGQILTVSSFPPDNGITLSDHSCSSVGDNEPSEFSTLSITPRASNMVTINSTKHRKNS